MCQNSDMKVVYSLFSFDLDFLSLSTSSTSISGRRSSSACLRCCDEFRAVRERRFWALISI